MHREERIRRADDCRRDGDAVQNQCGDEATRAASLPLAGSPSMPLPITTGWRRLLVRLRPAEAVEHRAQLRRGRKPTPSATPKPGSLNLGKQGLRTRRIAMSNLRDVAVADDVLVER